MKKILISAYNLQIGGIEKSLVNLINYLVGKNDRITLVLEEKSGDFLGKIHNNVQIIHYKPSTNSIIIIRKLYNLFKRIVFLLKYKNRFDTSISFATYSKSGAFVARNASKNSCLWCHADYLELYQGDIVKVKSFFKELKYNKFNKIVFVSKVGMENFLKIFSKFENVYFCNNLIDYEEIYKEAKEEIEYKYDINQVTFLNIGRHDENQKKLTRVIEAAKLLDEENYKFRIIFVGDGEDTEKYKNLCKKYKLEKKIIFVGRKKNPYPYYNIADAIVLSSDFEGYPLVFLESLLFEKPLITTDVSDFKEIQAENGIITNKSIESLYNAMKQFIEKGYKIKKKFNVVNYNDNIKKQLDNII